MQSSANTTDGSSLAGDLAHGLSIDALKKAYDRDGFVHVPALFSAGEVARFVVAANTLLDREARAGVRNVYDAAFSQVKLPAQKCDTLRELTLDRKLAVLAGALSGMSRIRVFLDRVLYKNPGGSPTKPHVDAPFLCFEDRRSLAAWVALTDTSVENGALSYYAGSHQRPLSYRSLESDGSIRKGDPSLDESTLRVLPARAGDVIFHSAYTIHSAGENTTAEARRAYSIQYMPDGARFAGSAQDFFADQAPAEGEPLDLPCFPRVL